MNPPLLEALHRLVEALGRGGVRHAVIGGIASSAWGEPRYTADVDVVIELPSGSESELVELVKQAGCRLPMPDPVEYLRKNRFLRLSVTGNVMADILVADFRLHANTVDRARTVTSDGIEVRMASPEDMILLKVISDRYQDQRDVRGILRRRLAELDLAYIETELAALAAEFETPSLRETWRGLLEEARERERARAREGETS